MGGIMQGAGGILSGSYQFVQGAMGLMGGSPGRSAADDEYRSAMSAASIGEVEAKQQGNAEAGKLRTLGSQITARQKVAYSNSGVDATVGTPASVMADTRLMSETDARMAENNAARKVRGYREQKRQAEQEYQRRIDQETQNAVGNLIGGFGSMLGGVASYKPED